MMHPNGGQYDRSLMPSTYHKTRLVPELTPVHRPTHKDLEEVLIIMQSYWVSWNCILESDIYILETIHRFYTTKHNGTEMKTNCIQWAAMPPFFYPADLRILQLLQK